MHNRKISKHRKLGDWVVKHSLAGNYVNHHWLIVQMSNLMLMRKCEDFKRKNNVCDVICLHFPNILKVN